MCLSRCLLGYDLEIKSIDKGLKCSFPFYLGILFLMGKRSFSTLNCKRKFLVYVFETFLVLFEYQNKFSFN